MRARDVANHVDMSRQSMYLNWPTLEKYGIVLPSRKIGGTTLYKTNPESPVVRALSKLALSVATHGVDEMNQTTPTEPGTPPRKPAGTG